MAATERILYVDSSALVKLVLVEPESASAGAAVASAPGVATSHIAVLEVARAIRRSNPEADALADAARLLRPFRLVEVDEQLVHDAARLPCTLRSLDAIHLASALTIRADSMLVYDVRLGDAAREAGLIVMAPV